MARVFMSDPGGGPTFLDGLGVWGDDPDTQDFAAAWACQEAERILADTEAGCVRALLTRRLWPAPILPCLPLSSYPWREARSALVDALAAWLEDEEPTS